MKLDDAQKARVSAWVEEGLKLADIQSRLASDLGVRLTYLEMRFLLDDLKLSVKNPETPAGTVLVNSQKSTAAEAPPASVAPQPTEPGLPAEPAVPGGGVSLSVDAITRAGALVSGKVTFSDGKSAEWQLDQYGRLGLGGTPPGYRPSQEDVAEFQVLLQHELGKLGY